MTPSSVLRENRLAIRRTCMMSFPRCTRNFTDSGKSSASSSVKISGAIAPVSSTLRQPWWGISQEEIAPPPAAPRGKPQYMALIAMARQRWGANSEISVMAFGMAAPSPRPVRKRHSVRGFRLCAQAVPRLARPKNRHEKTSTRLRPIRSDTGPAISAPSDSPSSAALSTGPRSCLWIPHSADSVGAM